MITETSDKKEILLAIDEPVFELLQLLSSVDEKKVNTVPYKESWTVGELLRHITKSTNGISMAMKQAGNLVQRNPGEKIPELKKIFLDFSHKMKSPEFIVPEKGPYEKQVSFNELKQSFEELKESAKDANLNEVAKGLPMGEVTKLELLHFVLYHTQRHLHQMNKITEALKDK